MDFIQITALSAAAISLITTVPLSVYILLSNPRSRPSQLLAAYTFFLSMSLQVVSVMVLLSGDNQALAWEYFRLAPLVALSFPVYYLFARSYLRIRGERWYLVLTALITLVNLYGIWRPAALFTITYSEQLGYYEFGDFHPPFYLAAISFFLWALGMWRFWQAHRQERVPLERNRLKYLAVAPLFTFVGILLVFIKSFHFLPFDMIGAALSAVLLAYATIKHELLDIKIIIRQSGLYTLLVGVILLILFALGAVVSLFSTQDLPSPIAPEPLVFTLLMAMVVHYFYFNQKRIQSRLKEERKLKELNEAIYVIAAHNLRTPLTAISGYIEAIQQSPELTPELQELVAHLSISTDKLLMLLRQLMELPKLEQQSTELSLTTVDLNRLLRQLYLAFWPQAEAKGLIMNRQIAEQTVYVKADQRKLEFSLMILIINALKYTQKGQIDLILERQGQWAYLAVQDTGRGISREDQDRLFEKFSQMGSYSAEWEGLGLSLYMMKKYIDAHDGLVGLDSKLGEGSTFWIKLPVVE